MKPQISANKTLTSLWASAIVGTPSLSCWAIRAGNMLSISSSERACSKRIRLVNQAAAKNTTESAVPMFMR